MEEKIKTIENIANERIKFDEHSRIIYREITNNEGELIDSDRYKYFTGQKHPIGVSKYTFLGKSKTSLLSSDTIANAITEETSYTVDVLVLGDSESYCSFIPMKIWEQHGITSYCCGTPAQKLNYSYYLLQKAFANQSPKVVLLETNALFRNFDSYGKLVQKADRLFSVFTHHNRWKLLNDSSEDASSGYVDIDNSKGYRFTTRIASAENTDYMKTNKISAVISPANRRTIEKILSFCSENGAELILVSAPSTLNWNQDRHDAVSKLSKELNINFVDLNLLNDDIKIDWRKDTRDKGDHLNYFGAEKVTAFLGKYLSETGYFSDKKNDERFKSWNDASENFNRTVSEIRKHEKS